MNDDLRGWSCSKSASQMLPVAKAAGMRLLREDGWRIVRKGLTTPEEVLRATKV